MKYAKKNGYYFVQGQGFATTDKAKATPLNCDALQCLVGLGFSYDSTESADKSFAVCYVRAVDLNGDGTVKANAKNPSRRRFATLAEARQHGSRFHVRKAKGSRVEGSAGHVGFYTIETNDPVNASVNWKTGLTNKL